MKYAVAGLGASAALAVIALNYQAPEGTQLFQNEVLTQADFEFIRYVSEYGKSYGTRSEFEFRNAQFKETLAKIEAHNSQNDATSTVGINHMSDWTHEEYKRLLGYKADQKVELEAPELPSLGLADEVNWVTKGAVTPVKNQGQCGSCWAFSSTGAIEGAEFVSTGKLTSLSEQNLVDCSTQNNACNGGLMDYAFMYVESHPLMTESDYPYTARKGHCQYDASKGVGQVKSYKDVSRNNSSQLKAAIAQQPVAVAIEADQFAFQGYTGGVITSGCGTQLDHGVLAVGYGTENGTPYYLVKNSWGPSWGVDGYVKLGVTSGAGVCGIQAQPSYPTE